MTLKLDYFGWTIRQRENGEWDVIGYGALSQLFDSFQDAMEYVLMYNLK